MDLRTARAVMSDRAEASEWLAAFHAMPLLPGVVGSDPEILSGMPVFPGTRVPAKNLTDYIDTGEPLAEFLTDFPSVRREQAEAYLRMRPRRRGSPDVRVPSDELVAGARSQTVEAVG